MEFESETVPNGNPDSSKKQHALEQRLADDAKRLREQAKLLGPGAVRKRFCGRHARLKQHPISANGSVLQD
jgi:hypothetical protein